MSKEYMNLLDQGTRVLYPFKPLRKSDNTNHVCGIPRPSASQSGRICTLPVDPGHPISSKWHNVAPKIIGILNAEDLKWTAVECFQRWLLHTPRSTDDTTIVITLPVIPYISEGIKAILHDIYVLSGTLYRSPLDTFVYHGTATNGAIGELFIELLQGTLNLHTEGFASHNEYVCEILFRKQPPVGGSIGLRSNSEPVGTLGCYVELLKAGCPTRKCALTCFHVVQARKKPYLGPFVAWTGRYKDLIPVCHPSMSDHERMIRVLWEDLAECKAEKAKLIQQIPTSLEITDSKTQGFLNRLSSQISFLEEKLECARLANREIGVVFATSGHSTHEGLHSVVRPDGSCVKRLPCRTNWALIDLYPDRAGFNIIQGISTGIEINQSIQIKPVPPFPPASKYPYCRVFKMGRTSGLTLGIINGVPSYISGGEPINKTTVELAIVSRSFMEPFSLLGDSGAPVLTGSGRLMGLLWGASQTQSPEFTPNVSYFTSIEVIFHDVLHRTGCVTHLLGREKAT